MPPKTTHIKVQNPWFGYPFGMTMEKRSISGGKFGFNGKENIEEIDGWQDYGMRMYNRLIGRFPTPDPLIVKLQQYPELSPYQFAGNTPIQAIDVDGLEILDYRTMFVASVTKTQIGIQYSLEIININKMSNAEYKLAMNTLNKIRFALGQKDMSAALSKLKGVQGVRITNPQVLIFGTNMSTNKVVGEIIDPNKQYINQKMNTITDMDDSPISYYEYNNNMKPAVGAAIAYMIEETCKAIYNNSPNMNQTKAYADLDNIKKAYNQAFEVVMDDYSNISKYAKMNKYNEVNMITDLVNYVVDGKLPESSNSEYVSIIKKGGDVYVNNLNQSKVKLNAE